MSNVGGRGARMTNTAVPPSSMRGVTGAIVRTGKVRSSSVIVTPANRLAPGVTGPAALSLTVKVSDSSQRLSATRGMTMSALVSPGAMATSPVMCPR